MGPDAAPGYLKALCRISERFNEPRYCIEAQKDALEAQRSIQPSEYSEYYS